MKPVCLSLSSLGTNLTHFGARVKDISDEYSRFSKLTEISESALAYLG
jgi:hypothetical protein